MAKYLFYPFAENGDRTSIPEPIQGDGSVSWSAGFTSDYELIYPINPAAKPVPRNQSNQYLFDISNGIKQYQEYGFNDFITNADNLGADFPYDVFAICRYDSGGGFNLYQSMETANDTLPTDTTKWRLLSGGIISISATDTITDDQINQEFDVDITAGDVDLTLPPAASWINGDTIKFRITAADGSENNKLRLLGDGAELISNYNDHDFYFVGSWVLIKKISTGLIIEDYNDAKSTIFKVFFDVGQTQATGGDAQIIYPSAKFNQGSFYNTGTGVALTKIRGEWEYTATLHRNSVLTDVTITYLHVNGVIIPGGSWKDWWDGNDPYSGGTVKYATVSQSDQVTVRGRDFGTVDGNNGTIIPGFSGTLVKRII